MYPRLLSTQDEFTDGMNVYDLFRNQVGTVVTTKLLHDGHIAMYHVKVLFPDGSYETYSPNGYSYIADSHSYNHTHCIIPYLFE